MRTFVWFVLTLVFFPCALEGRQDADRAPKDQEPIIQRVERMPVPEPVSSIAIVDVTLVDPGLDPAVAPNQTVLIEEGLITDVTEEQRAFPDDTLVIDGQGKYLIPGLWDMHVHLSFWGEPDVDGGAYWGTTPIEGAYGDVIPQFVGWGVVGLRDMGGHLEEIDQWREGIEEERVVGPRIYRSGFYVDGPKKNDKFRRFARDAVEARRVVGEFRQEGVDFLKVHSRLPREAYFALADEAAAQDMVYCGHVPHGITIDEAAQAGQATIEHIDALGFVSPDDGFGLNDWPRIPEYYRGTRGQTILEALVENDTFFTPTLIVFNVGLANHGIDASGVLPHMIEMIGMLHDHGVRLLAGTDTARKTFGLTPGKGLHGELELFVQAGLSPLEALRAATRHPAEVLGLEEEHGGIEEGMVGDVLLLSRNPLKDIKATQEIEAVIYRGRCLNREALKTLRSGG